MTLLGLHLWGKRKPKPRTRPVRDSEPVTVTMSYGAYRDVLDHLASLGSTSVPAEDETASFLRDWYLEETSAVAAAAEALEAFVDGKADPTVAEEALP